MKVYEKIKEFNDANNMSKIEIRDMCYGLKYCPLDIEHDHNFIGADRIVDLCTNNECDIKCLEKYLDMEMEGE